VNPALEHRVIGMHAKDLLDFHKMLGCALGEGVIGARLGLGIVDNSQRNLPRLERRGERFQVAHRKAGPRHIGVDKGQGFADRRTIGIGPFCQLIRCRARCVDYFFVADPDVRENASGDGDGRGNAARNLRCRFMARVGPGILMGIIKWLIHRDVAELAAVPAYPFQGIFHRLDTIEVTFASVATGIRLRQQAHFEGECDVPALQVTKSCFRTSSSLARRTTPGGNRTTRVLRATVCHGASAVHISAASARMPCHCGS
jgi:hypothetical protein